MMDDLNSSQEIKISRADPSSLVPFARHLCETGKSPEEIVREIYNVDFPDEFYLFEKWCIVGNLDLSLQWLHHPWELIVSLERGGPSEKVDPWSEEQEKNAFSQAPHVVLLMELYASDAIYGDYFIGYDLNELSEGRTTIVGHEDDIPENGAKFEIIGSSMLEVLHAWMSDHYRMVQAQYNKPSNRGAGSLRKKNVEEVAEQLRGIEAMQTELASKTI